MVHPRGCVRKLHCGKHPGSTKLSQTGRANHIPALVLCSSPSPRDSAMLEASYWDALSDCHREHIFNRGIQRLEVKVQSPGLVGLKQLRAHNVAPWVDTGGQGMTRGLVVYEVGASGHPGVTKGDNGKKGEMGSRVKGNQLVGMVGLC